jgi:hypothetical protein
MPGRVGTTRHFISAAMTSCAECGANTLASRTITLLIDTASLPWLTDVIPRRVFIGRAARGLGRSQKDGLPSCRGRVMSGSRPSTRARGAV